MPTDRQMKLFKKAFASKQAFMPLTDQAMAAQGAPAGAPPMDPAMMAQGGAPMPPPGAPMPPQGGIPPIDPATGMPIDPATGMPIDPNTGMPMDPAMMVQGGMPPAGAPMPPVDPNTGMPMDPAMMQQGGASMPPQGPIQTGDLAIDMLLEMGAMIVDPNGQPVPPEAIAQIVAEINAQGGGQQGGAAMGNEEVMTTLGQMDKTIALLLDKVDALRDIVDSVLPEKEPKSKDVEESVNDMDAELEAYLAEQAAQGSMPQEVPVEGAPIEVAPAAGISHGVPAGIDPAQLQQLGLIQAMQQGA